MLVALSEFRFVLAVQQWGVVCTVDQAALDHEQCLAYAC
jgi:hypothetical protein